MAHLKQHHYVQELGSNNAAVSIQSIEKMFKADIGKFNIQKIFKHDIKSYA